MLQTSCSPEVQKAVNAQIAKANYQCPTVSSVSLGSVGKVGPLAFAGNSL